MDRKQPTLREKLAALALTIKVEDDGQLVPLVTRDEAKQMTADQILSLLQWDHDPVPVALGGTNHPTNLVARPILEHRIKTAKKDVPAIAKTERISKSHQEFQRKLLAKTGQAEAPEAKRFKAVLPGSRASRFKKKINGQVVPR